MMDSVQYSGDFCCAFPQYDLSKFHVEAAKYCAEAARLSAELAGLEN